MPATLILTHPVPCGLARIDVDDTLCHKRGAKVAFAGIFLDAVLSTKRHETFRFGLNWVVLGIAVPIPMRADRDFCLPVLWRLDRKQRQAGHRPRPRSAAELARRLAEANPTRTFWLVGEESPGDRAAAPEGGTVRAARPLRWKGRRPKKGRRLPTPKAMIEDTQADPAEAPKVAFPKETRELRVQVIRDLRWYRGSKDEPVLVRVAAGEWRDEALVATDPGSSAAFVITGYGRRWGVKPAFFDSKQFVGLHERRVRSERGVERAHPMAWMIGSLTILRHGRGGHEGSQVIRERPW